MFDFHERRRIKGWLFAKPSIALLLIASLFLARSVFRLYEKERAAAERYAASATQARELEARATSLEAKIAYLESERGKEEEIRRRFDVVKEGERAVVIVEDERRVATKGVRSAEGARMERTEGTEGGVGTTAPPAAKRRAGPLPALQRWLGALFQHLRD